MASASLVRRGLGAKGNGVAGHDSGNRSDEDNDPDTDRLLPATAAKRKRHQVRIQGKLVLVRSASTTNLRAPPSAAPPLPSPRSAPLTTSPTGQSDPAEHARKSHMRPRATGSLDERREQWRRSSASTEDDNGYNGSHHASGSDVEEDDRDTALRDRQRRGYGIGGAGNIRRPTEVVHFYSSSKRTVATPPGHERDQRRRWHWTNLLGWKGRKGSAG